MRRPAVALVACVAIVGAVLVPAPAAQALPVETAEVCTTDTISPVRGNGEHPVQTGPRHVTAVLPEFDTALGDLVSVRVVATVSAEVTGEVTNKSGTEQTFTPTIGGTSFAGRTGANGYIDLGRVVVQPEIVVPAGATVGVGPDLNNNVVAKNYTPELWNSLGAFDAYVVIDDEFTSTSVFEWGFVTDRVRFTTCVKYSYVPSVERVAGTDRYSTSAEIALAANPDPSIVYVATGANYPDALAAGPIAAQFDAPLLLVTPTSVPAPVAAALEELDPDHIVVVGGAASISAAVYNQLATYADEIARIDGPDRFATSRALARTVFDTADRAFIATGTNFPDALSAGPAAFAFDAPVILVNGGASTLDAATEDLLDELGVTEVVIVGGTASVSAGVADDLASIATVRRVSGGDRFATSHEVNYFAFDTASSAFFATGLDFPDALSGSAWAAASGSPLFVVRPDCVPDYVLNDLEFMEVGSVTLLGGTNSLSPEVAALSACG